MTYAFNMAARVVFTFKSFQMSKITYVRNESATGTVWNIQKQVDLVEWENKQFVCEIFLQITEKLFFVEIRRSIAYNLSKICFLEHKCNIPKLRFFFNLEVIKPKNGLHLIFSIFSTNW